VQEAVETTWCFFLSYAVWLTPMTIMKSQSDDGAEMRTFFARGEVLRGVVAFGERPVDSITTSTPSLAHGSLAGSVSASP